MEYEIYAKIRDFRGLKDGKVAELAGIGRSTFSDWKSGRSEPKMDKLEKIAKALNCSTYELIRGRLREHMVAEKITDLIAPFPPEAVEIIDLYARATPEQQKAVLNLLRSFVSE